MLPIGRIVANFPLTIARSLKREMNRGSGLSFWCFQFASTADAGNEESLLAEAFVFVFVFVFVDVCGCGGPQPRMPTTL